MSERFPITLTLPFDFTDEEGRTFNVGHDHDKNLLLCRKENENMMVIRVCTLEEAREWFARTKGDKK